jgi:hypothetical protein
MDESQFSEPTKRWLAQGRRMQVHGQGRLFVYERGQGPAVLLLHGFPTCSYDWRGVIDGLADGYHCIAPTSRVTVGRLSLQLLLFQQTTRSTPARAL